MNVVRLSQSRAVRVTSMRLLRGCCSLAPRRPASTAAALGPLRSGVGAGGNAQSRQDAPHRMQTRGAATSQVVPPADVAVIGGGLTGLTTAYFLAKALPQTARITLYEGADELGGWVKTVQRKTADGKMVQFENGARVLRGLGKTSFRADDYVLYELISMLQLDVKVSPPRKKLMYFNDKLVYLPPVGVTGWLKVLWELLRGKHIASGIFKAYTPIFRRNYPPDAGKYDISVSEWLRMVCGDNPAVRRILSGMVHGIWGGSLDKLSVASVLPAVWYGIHRPPPPGTKLVPKQDHDLMKELHFGRWGPEKEESMRELSVQEVISFPNGMSAIVHALRVALAACPGVTIRTGSPVSKIRYLEKQDKIELISPSGTSVHDKVISTTPSTSLAPLIPSVPLPTDSVTIRTVSFWYPEENLTSHLDAFGYLVPITTPNPEQVLGVFFDSDTYGFATGEARGTKLTVLMGGHFWSDLPSFPDEATCVERAKAAVARHVDIAAEPGLTYTHLAEDCIPQHGPAHRPLLAQAHAALHESFKGKLAVAGGSYTHIGALAAMRAGFDVACHVAGHPRDHVGDTGLAQFGNEPLFHGVPVAELNSLGKTLGRRSKKKA